MTGASTIEVKHELAVIASDELAETECLDSVELSCAAVRTWTGVAHAQNVAPQGGSDGVTSGGDGAGAIFRTWRTAPSAAVLGECSSMRAST